MGPAQQNNGTNTKTNATINQRGLLNRAGLRVRRTDLPQKRDTACLSRDVNEKEPFPKGLGALRTQDAPKACPAPQSTYSHPFGNGALPCFEVV